MADQEHSPAPVPLQVTQGQDDEDKQHEPPTPEPGDDNEQDVSDDQDETSDDEPVESLVQGRHRRSTQANRYASLLEQEAAADGDDDDLALLFAEADEEDVEFEDPDAPDASEAADDDDSSTDDEDQGPTAAPDDLEGEDLLQKEERAAKRAQKRKADNVFVKPSAARKKVKIDDSASPSDPSQPGGLADRKRKLSERISWVPTDAPARTSSRTLSVQNKVRTMASMKESESRRIRQIAVMEAAQKRKDANKAKPMTQADRLAEAAETERVNSQSLSKWEEMEKERVQKQKARLEAMQNRKIEGPFITCYSAKAQWIDGKLKWIGKHPVTEVVEDKLGKDGEPKKRTWKKKARLLDTDASTETASAATVTAADTQESEPATQEPLQPDGNPSANAPVVEGALEPLKTESTEATAEAEKSSQLSTIYDQPNLFDSPPGKAQDAIEIRDQSKDASEINGQNQSHDRSDSKNANQAQDVSEITENQDFSEITANQDESQKLVELDGRDQAHDTSKPDDQDPSQKTSLIQDQPQSYSESKPQADAQSSPIAPVIELEPLQNREQTPARDPAAAPEADVDKQGPVTLTSASSVTEYSARNLLTLQNFDSTSIQDISVLRHVVLGTPLPTNFSPAAPSTRINARVHPQLPSKPTQPVCAITGHPAKYRDPATGLPYANLDGYRAIRKLVDGGCVWSNLLGAWCGGDGKMLSTGGAARGVPEGFFSGVKPQRPPLESVATEDTVKMEVV